MIWSWLLAFIAGGVILAMTVIIAKRKAQAWNGTHFPTIERKVAALVENYGPMNLCIETTGDINILVSAAHLHLVDEKAAVVRQTIPIDSIDFVTVHDESTAYVAFTIVRGRGDELPKMRVQSLAEFASLFNVFIDFGKPVRFAK